ERMIRIEPLTDGTEPGDGRGQIIAVDAGGEVVDRLYRIVLVPQHQRTDPFVKRPVVKVLDDPDHGGREVLLRKLNRLADGIGPSERLGDRLVDEYGGRVRCERAFEPAPGDEVDFIGIEEAGIHADKRDLRRRIRAPARLGGYLRNVLPVARETRTHAYRAHPGHTFEFADDRFGLTANVPA